MRYELTLGSANIDGIYGLGSVKITKPNPADTTFTANCDTVKRQLTPNTWYNIKYIYQPGASSIKVYLNDELFNTRSVPPENKIMSTSVANGFRFVAVKGTKITNGVYFDNAEIYQMEKLIGIKSMSFNETSGELFIDFETNINASELDKIILKHSNENVTNLITSRRILSNAHNAILNLNASNMVIGGEYSVELPVGFTDMNEQFIKEIYKKNFIASSPKAVYIDDSLTTFTAPSASGASASVTFKTEESIAKNAWVSMAVFGAYNELISIDTKNISVLEPFKADFSVATDCSNATKIMIFSWDSENGMVPYEKSKMIWGNQ
ncbi:MAG: hypothetical protein RR957_07470, partial [Oscillospiraceae bacterium]